MFGESFLIKLVNTACNADNSVMHSDAQRCASEEVIE